jgi:exportin-T
MDTSDATIEKLAFSVLNRMVLVWTPPFEEGAVADDISTSGFEEAFGQFVIEHLSRVCFEVPAKETFDSADAQSRLVYFLKLYEVTQVLAEIAILQKSIYSMKGDAVTSYLQARLFPSLGLPPSSAQTYIDALSQMDLKQFKTYFMVSWKLQATTNRRILRAGNIKAFSWDLEHCERK